VLNNNVPERSYVANIKVDIGCDDGDRAGLQNFGLSSSCDAALYLEGIFILHESFQFYMNLKYVVTVWIKIV
jgi:hypothetical protein